jgi:hypothetical protein
MPVNINLSSKSGHKAIFYPYTHIHNYAGFYLSDSSCTYDNFFFLEMNLEIEKYIN